MPRLVISYSHDDDRHCDWALKLAEHLRYDCVDAKIDQFVEPAPEGGWWNWVAKEFESADRVLCVCTKGYYDRYMDTLKGKGQGVRQEIELTNNILQRSPKKVVIISRGPKDPKGVPLSFEGSAHYELPIVLSDPKASPRVKPGRDYDKLLKNIRGDALVAEPPIGPLPQRTSPFQALSTLDGASRPFAKLRLTFHDIGTPTYRVTLQSRGSTDAHFVIGRAQVDIDSDLHFLFKTIDGQTSNCVTNTINSAREKGHPIRIQIHLFQSARRLDRLDWENAPLLDCRLYEHGDIAFSRSFAVQDEEAPDIRISPKGELSFALAHATKQPAVPGRTPGHLIWSGLDAVSEYEKALREQKVDSVSWGDELARSFALTLTGVDVLFLPLLVAADQESGKAPLLAIPDADDRLVPASIGDLVKKFLGLEERPIVIFLAPSGDVSKQHISTFEVTREIASELAERGVASVVSLHGPMEHRDWVRFLALCSSALRADGVIDAAVAFAKNGVPAAAPIVRLYLRNKSARLWYKPGFSAVGLGRGQLPEEPWEELKRVFEASTPQPSEGPRCVVLLGPGIDREVKLTRRSIARDMARKNGFSLSHRDEESLARVAEFIRARPNVRSAQDAGVQSDPPDRQHVRAFLEGVHLQLWKELGEDRKNFREYAPKPSFDRANTLALIRCMGERRKREEGTLYPNLGSLKVSTFITTNFQELLQQALVDAGRDPTTAYTILQSARYRRGRTTESNFRVLKSHQPAGDDKPLDQAIDVSRPLVYHAYGTFNDLDSLVLAESDHLGFFADFITPHDRNAAWDQIRGQLLDGTLIFLGFHPDSWNFRVLFAAITQLGGSDAISMNNKPHVAVQLDPEDDLIIDPEGARAYFEALLAPLGHRVFVYWGSPDTFLEDMRRNVPSAFLENSRPVQSAS